jgi:hypothetical protein
VAAAGTVAASVTITLDGSGVYILDLAAFSMGANVIIVDRGATAEDVFWIAEGAVAIGADATIKGNLISNNGAVDLATGCSVEGKLLAINRRYWFIDLVTNTGNSSAVNWDLASSLPFSTGGTISNAGSSTIRYRYKIRKYYKILFDAATVNGTFYTTN